MKQLAIVCLLFAAACNNASEDAKPQPDSSTVKPVEKAPDNKISFKVGDESVNTTAGNINRFDFRHGASVGLNFSSDGKAESKHVNITVNASQPGTYPFDGTADGLNTAGKAYGEYMPDANAERKEHYFFKSGSVTIIDIDTAKNIVNATFTGEGKNDKGKTVQITDGKVVMGVMHAGVAKF